MASKTGILTIAFLSLSFLPLLASAFFPGFPGFPGNNFFNPVYQPPNPVYQPPDPVYQGPDRGQVQDGDDSAVLIDPTKPEDEPDHGRVQDGDNSAVLIDPTKPENEPERKPEPKLVEDQVNGALEGELEPVKEGLQVGFYERSCPRAEKIMNDTIYKHFQKNPRYAPAIVRMHFHDCFVKGCDASILLDTTPTSEVVEKKARQNGPFTSGYEVIDAIKTELEAECPGIVSCADIIAYANRDSLVYTGVPRYEVEGGRRDGLASLEKNVPGNLPVPESSAQENLEIFQKKGFTLEELVVLVGAHSIGNAHCTIVSPRFHDPVKSKEIDKGYLFKMQTLSDCRNDSQDLAFDSRSQHKMDSRYYKELLSSQALLESDHNLAKEPRTRNVMQKLVDDNAGWLAKFTAAVKKLGRTEVLTGQNGEIRKQCRAVNGK